MKQLLPSHLHLFTEVFSCHLIDVDQIHLQFHHHIRTNTNTLIR